MSTINKTIADVLVKNDGMYPGDHLRVVEITQYLNAWGKYAYGIMYEGQPNKYTPSPYVQEPECYWAYKARSVA